MLLIQFLLCILLTGIYDIQITSIDGTAVSMSKFRQQKILLVNIATGSPRVGQLGELQQLHQQYGDSLVIIAFPSESFGHEARTNEEIARFCRDNWQVGFLLAAKDPVTGTAQQPLYHWLTTLADNGVNNTAPAGDFHKFLIGKEGNIIGIFAPSVSPLDSTLINAIKDTQ
ncbi:glutathione peroxidase [Paraflavitalea soli]|nr:glutathione peroxidase [Paraflavitalea soli]